MRITVVGASGMMGSKVVREIKRNGHEVTQASTRTGVNVLTGDGLQSVLVDADVVIDVTDSGSFGSENPLEFFKQAGKNLLGVAKGAGISHYIALSVVGTDRLVENDYFRAKMVQENLIRASGVPYTIIRSTQFFKYLDGIINSTADDRAVRLPPAPVRPVAADEAAGWISTIAGGPARNGIVEIGGPESLLLSELAPELMNAMENPRAITVDASILYLGVELAGDTLLPGNGALAGTVSFHDWLRQAMAA